MATLWTWISPSAEATHALGRVLGEHAKPGLVIALLGELGAGKTALAQGIARGLGIPESVAVTSPTYTLVNPYSGRLEFFHLDLYRLSDIDELEVLGFRDIFNTQAVTAIEWADQFLSEMPRSYLRIDLEIVDHSSRKVEARAIGEGIQEEELLTQLTHFEASILEDLGL